MKKELLAVIALVAPLAAQVPPAGNSFHQAGWVRMPGSGAYSVHSDRIEGQSGPITGKPLSATETRRSEQILSDGSRISNSETESFYRDGMGRMLTKTSTGAILYDPIAGFTYDLTQRNKTYTKSPITPNATVTIAAAAHRSSVSSHTGQVNSINQNAVTEDLPQQMLNGVEVKGTRITITIPTGAIGNDRDLKVVNERWFSDSLKILVKSSNSDPRFGVTTYELTNISQTVPDPALFQIPADYTEGSHH